MNPRNASLEPGEKVVRIIRKHWFVLYAQVALLVFALCAPILLHVAVFLIPTAKSFALSMGLSVFVYLYSFWTLLVWMALFSILTNYYLDTWTLTTKHLIIIDQRGFFNRRIGSFRLDRIQDVHISIDGIIPTFLDFGRIEIETASGDREFVANGMPDPQSLKLLILQTDDQQT